MSSDTLATVLDSISGVAFIEQLSRLAANFNRAKPVGAVLLGIIEDLGLFCTTGRKTVSQMMATAITTKALISSLFKLNFIAISLAVLGFIFCQILSVVGILFSTFIKSERNSSMF